MNKNGSKGAQQIHLAIAFDENYLHPFYALLNSVFSNNQHLLIVLHVIATGMAEDVLDRIKTYVASRGGAIVFYTIDETLVKKFVLINQWTSAVYYRLFFPLMMQQEVSRLLYLDTDTLVIGDLEALYFADMEGFPVAAVYDNYVKTQPLLGIHEDGAYFNSGMLLMDVPKWREQKISERAFEFLISDSDKIRFVDQCALNAVLRNNWKKLDGKFNLMYSLLPEELSRREIVPFLRDKVIIHFTLQRPWSMLCKNRLDYLYFQYLKTSPVGPQARRYTDFNWRKLPQWLNIRLLNLYFDVPLLHKSWRKIKETLRMISKSKALVRKATGFLSRVAGNSRIDYPVIPNSQPSVIVPTESWKAFPNDRLINLSVRAIPLAGKVDHTDIVSKMEEYPHWPNIWPGEHYKLLSAFIQVLKPKLVIEIGTATGYSALAMKKFMSLEGRIITYDIVPWKEFPKCVLRETDFEDGVLKQTIADLSDRTIFDQHRDILQQADFIFIDAAKDGVQEQVFIDNFKTLQFLTDPILMFDDIRLMNMIEIWNNLDRPKLDLTSFGHWAGTGLVDWKG